MLVMVILIGFSGIKAGKNLDLMNEKWPTVMPCVPQVGDYIQSTMRWDGGFQLTLEVVSITWKATNKMEWVPTIELHIKKNSNMSITDFYNWYAPKVGRSPSAFI